MDPFNSDLTYDSTPDNPLGLDEPRRGYTVTAYTGYNANTSAGNQQERSVSGPASDIKLFLKGRAAVVQKPTTSQLPPIPKTAVPFTSHNIIKVLTATTINQNAELVSANKNAHKIQVSVTPKLYAPPPMMNTAMRFPAGIPRSFLKDSNYPVPAVPPPVMPGPFAPPPLSPEYFGTDVSEDVGEASPDDDEGESSPGGKRRSAFQRLGPVAPAKKTKLTINLLFSKEQAVREVVTEPEPPPPHVPVPERPDMLASANEAVLKYLPHWPWKLQLKERRTAIYRESKSAMLMEKREIMKTYGHGTTFFKVVITGYPPNSTKEEILDIVLESIKGKTMIPCFIEFTPQKCYFLVLRSSSALEALHNNSLTVRRDALVLRVGIAQLDLTLSQLDFIPTLVLRRLVKDRYRDAELDCSGFCLEYDVSHLLYYPLNRMCNQVDLFKTHSPMHCESLHTLNLSGNRLTTIDGFSLALYTPNLKKLDLSNNLLEKVTLLLSCRNMPLQSLNLENNPLCYDFLSPAYYVRVLKMMFPTLREIDGTRITRGGELPPALQNYCPLEAAAVVERFLEVFFPLLEARDMRKSMVDMYEPNAVFSLSYDYKLRFTPTFRLFREMFAKARIVEEDILDCVEGSSAIAKHFTKWPPLLHDPSTFSVDVLHHDDVKIVFNVNGLVRLIADDSPDERHILKFTRSVVLRAENEIRYRICNELLTFQEPKCENEIEKAFNDDLLASKRVNSKMQGPISQEIKNKLIEIFVKLTDCKPEQSESCLVSKEWDLRSALEYFADLVANDGLHTLSQTMTFGNQEQAVQ